MNNEKIDYFFNVFDYLIQQGRKPQEVLLETAKDYAYVFYNDLFDKKEENKLEKQLTCKDIVYNFNENKNFILFSLTGIKLLCEADLNYISNKISEEQCYEYLYALYDNYINKYNKLDNSKLCIFCFLNSNKYKSYLGCDKCVYNLNHYCRCSPYQGDYSDIIKSIKKTFNIHHFIDIKQICELFNETIYNFKKYLLLNNKEYTINKIENKKDNKKYDFKRFVEIEINLQNEYEINNIKPKEKFIDSIIKLRNNATINKKEFDGLIDNYIKNNKLNKNIRKDISRSNDIKRNFIKNVKNLTKEINDWLNNYNKEKEINNEILIEKIARIICKDHGYNPDQLIDYDYTRTYHQPYFIKNVYKWEEYSNIAKEILKEI